VVSRRLPVADASWSETTLAAVAEMASFSPPPPSFQLHVSPHEPRDLAGGPLG